MKIGAYVFSKHAKQNYKKESFNTRLYAGLQVVIDIINRAGYQVDFISKANVKKYDVILVSITSDCDWWTFIKERQEWDKGNYKVIVGGAGVLNVRPFLDMVDYFVLGRVEGLIDKLIRTLEKYFDVEKLFGNYNSNNLPTRYLKTYANIDKMWP